MGIWDDLMGAKSSASSRTKGTTTQTESGTQRQTQTGKTSQTATSGSTVSSLDAGTVSLLQNLTQKLAPGVVPGGTSPAVAQTQQLAQALMSRALSPGTVEADINAQQQAARRDFNTGQGAQIAQVQQQIGSKNNAFAQALAAEGQAALETNLAKIASDIRFQARTTADAEIASALQAVAQGSALGIAENAAPLQSLLGVIDVLRGATTTTEGFQETQGIEELLNNLVSSGTMTQNVDQKTTGKQTSSPGILPGLKSLFS